MKIEITLALVLSLYSAVSVQESSTETVHSSNTVETDNSLSNTDLVLAYVVFRHGDRTPDEEEIALNPSDKRIFNLTATLFPYGTKALTNAGKRRGYLVGKYLRRRYDGLISSLYLPDEIVVRTTDYDRTKMTALTALAAMYPPLPTQKWNPSLNWQPVPYDTLPAAEDDLLYWYNCPRYLSLRDKVYEEPTVKKQVKKYHNLFVELSKRTGTNITTPEDVFYLDNLFQALENVNVSSPEWAKELLPRIKEMTKIEYAIENYNIEMIQIATGILMAEILNATSAAVAGDLEQPKLRLFSAHENNVAAIMAAARVFQPHQPKYGATFSLELRQDRLTGQFGIAAVYAPVAGGPASVLPISGCGGWLFCDFKVFLKLAQEATFTRTEFDRICPQVVATKNNISPI